MEISYYALITMIGLFMVLSLGFYVYSKDIRSNIHILFMVISVCTAFNLFSEFQLMTSHSNEEATFWLLPILLIWPLLFAIQSHFLIVYTNRFLKHRIKLLFLIYTTALIAVYFSRYEYTINLYDNSNIWLRFPGVSKPLTSFVLGTYSTFVEVLMTYLAISHFRKTKIKIEKQQSLLIFVGILFPAFLNFIKNVLLAEMKIYVSFPESIVTFAGWIFFVIAIWRFKVFDITPKSVADKIIETIKDALLLVESSGKVITANNAFYSIFNKKSEEVLNHDLVDVLEKLTCRGEKITNLLFENEINNQLCTIEVGKGIPLVINLTSSPLYNEVNKKVGAVLVLSDITLVYTARQEIEKKQKEMTEMAHHAGMSMMAADVMHNIGNIMNSINVSSEKILNTVNTSRLADLKNANSLLHENRGRLSEYFANDTNAGLLPEYYMKVSKLLEREYETIKNEGQVLIEKNKLIKDSIDIQMDVIGAKNFSEQVMISTLINDVIGIQSGRISKYKIDVEKDFKIPPTTIIEVYKSKLLNVLLNVFQNALQAVMGNTPGKRNVWLTIDKTEQNKYQIEISDNGIGISKEVMGNIYSHGYTTKEKGHGFGLHYCAYTIKELNGSIEAFSEGPGKGARFTITF